MSHFAQLVDTLEQPPMHLVPKLLNQVEMIVLLAG